jgi:hypothetical protein
MNTKCYTLVREANKSTQASKRSEMLFILNVFDHDEKPHSGTVVQFFDEHNEMCDDFMIQDEGHNLVISSRLSYPIQTIRRVWSILIYNKPLYGMSFARSDKMCANAQNLVNEIQSEHGYSVLT